MHIDVSILNSLTPDMIKTYTLIILIILNIFHFFRIRRIENLRGVKDYLREKKAIRKDKKFRKQQEKKNATKNK